MTIGLIPDITKYHARRNIFYKELTEFICVSKRTLSVDGNSSTDERPGEKHGPNFYSLSSAAGILTVFDVSQAD